MDHVNKIATTTKELLDMMDISAEVEITHQAKKEAEDRDTYYVDINGEELGLLIGYKGENLSSLETVIGIISNNGATEKARVILDIGGWRQERYAQIEKIVDQALARIEDEDEIALPPMKPYERRKAHELITSRGYLTESIGTEPNRRILIQKPSSGQV